MVYEILKGLKNFEWKTELLEKGNKYFLVDGVPKFCIPSSLYHFPAGKYFVQYQDINGVLAINHIVLVQKYEKVKEEVEPNFSMLKWVGEIHENLPKLFMLKFGALNRG